MMIELSPGQFGMAAAAVRSVDVNNLFARSVVEHKVRGRVYADDDIRPASFYVVHPYGMTMLVGATNRPLFNQALLRRALNDDGQRTTTEWMQAFPRDWDPVLADLFGERLVPVGSHDDLHGLVELNTRVLFRFDPAAYADTRPAALPPGIEVRCATREDLAAVRGSVVPNNFWDGEDEFLAHGVGFTLLDHGRPAALAFSSFLHDDRLELGIETLPEHRGKGYGRLACAALIDVCLEQGLTPVWACREANTASFRLALALGFVTAERLPYYRLSP